MIDKGWQSLLLLGVPEGLASGVSLDSLGRGSALAFDGASDLDDPGVDGAGDAVLHFDVELGDDVGFEGSVLLEVLLGGCVDDVPDGEALDCLVLRTESAAVDTDDGLHKSSVVLVATVVSTLDGHVVN
jgi:hypothetical protein